MENSCQFAKLFDGSARAWKGKGVEGQGRGATWLSIDWLIGWLVALIGIVGRQQPFRRLLLDAPLATERIDEQG